MTNNVTYSGNINASSNTSVMMFFTGSFAIIIRDGGESSAPLVILDGFSLVVVEGSGRQPLQRLFVFFIDTFLEDFVEIT